MAECAAERRAIAEHLEGLGFTVRWFEEFGGRDDNAEAAYLSEVRSATLYLGLLGDAYGSHALDRPLRRISATHAEYLEARRQGKRVSFWVRHNGNAHEGHARNFLTEVRLFHVTGSFTGPDDLREGREKRLREIAAEDLAPWSSLATSSSARTKCRSHQRDHGPSASPRRRRPPRAGRSFAGDPRGLGRNDIAITYSNRSGTGRIHTLTETSTSAAFTDMTVEAQVAWSQSVDSTSAGTQGYTAEDLTELAIKVGLLRSSRDTERSRAGWRSSSGQRTRSRSCKRSLYRKAPCSRSPGS